MTEPTNDESSYKKVAQLEKVAKIQLDSTLCKGSISLILLYDRLQQYSKDMKKYMNAGSANGLKEFLVKRGHLWKITENEKKEILIEKQPEDIRMVLVEILSYIQEHCQKNEEGIKLGDVSSYTGGKFVKFRQQLKIKGFMIGVKEFLQDYPNLFLLDPFFEGANLLELKVKNVGIIVDHTILPFGSYHQSNPMYLEGTGKIVRLLPQQLSYGFIRDAVTGDDVYFHFDKARNIPKNCLRVGQFVLFKAVQSQSFKRGKTQNKWRAFHLEIPGYIGTAKPDNVNVNDNIVNNLRRCESSMALTVTGTQEENWMDELSSRLSQLKASEATPIPNKENTMKAEEQKEVNYKCTSTRTIGIQTDTMDDVEMVMRVMKRNPDLLRLALRSMGYSTLTG